MNRIERLTTVDHDGKRETIRVEIEAEGPAWIIGRRVDREGVKDEAHYEGDTLVETVRMIAVECVVQRVPLRVDTHYGVLVDDV